MATTSSRCEAPLSYEECTERSCCSSATCASLYNAVPLWLFLRRCSSKRSALHRVLRKRQCRQHADLLPAKTNMPLSPRAHRRGSSARCWATVQSLAVLQGTRIGCLARLWSEQVNLQHLGKQWQTPRLRPPLRGPAHALKLDCRPTLAQGCCRIGKHRLLSFSSLPEYRQMLANCTFNQLHFLFWQSLGKAL